MMKLEESRANMIMMETWQLLITSLNLLPQKLSVLQLLLWWFENAVALSVDHKPSREDEYDRIELAGGEVIQWHGHRFFGVLAMSRAIGTSSTLHDGDRYLKLSIILEPEVMFVPRAREDQCLILGCDVLWDVMANEEACEVARKRILIWHKRNGSTLAVDRGQIVDPAAQAAA